MGDLTKGTKDLSGEKQELSSKMEDPDESRIGVAIPRGIGVMPHLTPDGAAQIAVQADYLRAKAGSLGGSWVYVLRYSYEESPEKLTKTRPVQRRK